MLFVFFSPLPNIDLFFITVLFILAAIKLTSGFWFIFFVFRITEKSGWLIVKKTHQIKSQNYVFQGMNKNK